MLLKSSTFLVAMSLLAIAEASATSAQPQAVGASPALCGRGDIREPGLQGAVPAGQTANYSCGVKLLGQLPISGNVAGTGTCAYVRLRGQGGTTPPADNPITVIDVRNPAKPVVVGDPLPVQNRTETFRVVVTKERSILVSGSTIYDIRDCLHPKLLGDIVMHDTTLPGIATKNFPHDMRINRAGTRVFYSFGIWEADISNLADPKSWKVTDHRCEVAAQVPGPWQELHRLSIKAGRTLCDDAAKPVPQGSNYQVGTSPFAASLLWPQVSHSPDLNADDTRLYVGDQAGGNAKLWAPSAKTRIFDISKTPYTLVGEVNGGGHGLDWFRSGGREYILHSNERGQAAFGDANPNTCRPLPRPTSLGWAFEAFISDVTDPAQARNVSTLTLATNDPQNCEAQNAAHGDASIAYHLIDNPLNAKFAAVNYGTAGFRIFDIRDPSNPTEVAYFNHGVPVHGGVGYYDAARKLIYFSDAGGFKVLEIEPQVRDRLRL
jgi:hypothetical protein